MESKTINHKKLVQYLLDGGAGASAKSMIRCFEGLELTKYHPSDHADFGRCVGLLEAFPEYRSRREELKAISPVWSLIVDQWDEMEAAHHQREALPEEKRPEWSDDPVNMALNEIRKEAQKNNLA